MKKLISFLSNHKYEILLVGLVQHLFIGIVLPNHTIYTKFIWPINMIILGVALVGVYDGTERWKKTMRNIFFFTVVSLPVLLHFAGITKEYMEWISIVYVFFFGFIFYELVRFMMRPSYVNIDIISAAICGYLVLLEIAIFLFQAFYYQNPSVLKGIDASSPGTVYMDMVYFCSVILTSIGFGDVLPASHETKLITAFLGIIGQFYSVVLVGVLISKFTYKTMVEEENAENEADAKKK